MKYGSCNKDTKYNDYESSSLDVIPTVVHTSTPNSEHITKWSKDHPLDNIIDELKTMQEEINEFKRLEVWELVHRPDKATVITLKWIYKVKLDELGGILKNKARLVARAPEVITPIADVVAPVSDDLTGSPFSTTVDQDAPSPSNSQTTLKTKSPVIPNDVKEENHDLDVARMNNNSFFGIPIPDNDYESIIRMFRYTLKPCLNSSTSMVSWHRRPPPESVL
nr:hypothetical protein [Tanacetum cinerariifolium]